jgi:alkyldihydroxyacetonephosphate synthase
VSRIVIDGASLLAHVEGGVTLDEAELALARERLTLGISGASGSSTIAAWLADGAPGAPSPWLDPADHLVAGIDATTPNGQRLSLRPAPRRAVGPDLVSLFVGTRGRFGTIDRVWLRVHPLDRERAAPHAFALVQPLPNEGEERLLEAVARELRAR